MTNLPTNVSPKRLIVGQFLTKRDQAEFLFAGLYDGSVCLESDGCLYAGTPSLRKKLLRKMMANGGKRPCLMRRLVLSQCPGVL